MAASVAQRRLSACWPLYAQRRLCSTLADVQSILQAVRRAKRLDGGTLRLSVTEDLRVCVEHQATPDSVASAVATWQGAAACTVREAVWHVHAAQETEAPPTSPAPSTFMKPPQRTLLDGAPGRAEDVQHAMHYLERFYPQLRLKVQHTSGVDLLGTKLHTISVRLVPRGLGVTVASLPTEQQRLAEKFEGEAVGDKYTGCMRRALKDAFAAAGLSYETVCAATAAVQSVLSLYTQLWIRDGFQLCLEPLDTVSSTSTVSCALRHASTGRTLASTCVGLTPGGLRSLMDFCDKTAAEHYRDGHAALHARLRAAPLHLVLPRTHLDVKGLLTKLLVFHYGGDASDLRVHVEASKYHTYRVEVQLCLSALHMTSDSDGRSVPPFVLGSAHGTSKATAVEAATVQVMRVLFPDIYARDIAYHPEIKAIVESERANATGAEHQPLASQGLLAQLQWALRREHATHVMESRLLKPNTAFPDIGVVTGSVSVWHTKVFLVPQVAADAAAAQRELLCTVYDHRKSRSEQKAIAAVLAKRFPQLCGPCIELARSRNLLDASGAPTPVSELRPLEDAGSSAYLPALGADSFLAALDVQQSRAAQPLPATPTDGSVLEKYWAATQTQDSLLGSITVERGTAGLSYTARCTRTNTTAAASQERVLASATASTEIGALLALFQSAQAVPEMVAADDAAAALATTALADVAAAAPTKLPTDTPLQTCAVTVAQLYGLSCSVLVRHLDTGWEADLFGVVPPRSALAAPHLRLAHSPFAAARAFLLGRGRGDSAAVAVLRGAAQVYEWHVRVHQRAFAGETVTSGELRLTPEPQSRLARLCGGVLAEIKAVRKRDVEDSALVLRWAQDDECRLHFSVTADSKTVVLEDARGANLLACTRELCRHIATETSGVFLSLAALADIKMNVAEAVLGELCRLAYGFALHTDVTARRDGWHCRLRLPLNAGMQYCIAEARGERKRDVVDAACLAAVRRHFAEELPHLGIAFAPPTEASTSVKVTCDPYVFRLDEAAPPG